MGRYNILLAGVGGQGLLTLGTIIGNAAILSGVNVTIAETHGLSQRGGSLVVHIRLGEGESPLIPKGAAHLIIGLEALETARYIEYANKNSTIIMNEFLWPPPLSKTPSIKDIIENIRKNAKLYVVDANSIALKETGLIVTANTVILGYALAVEPELKKIIDVNAVEKALEKVFKGKALELNKKALYKGYEEGLKNTL